MDKNTEMDETESDDLHSPARNFEDQLTNEKLRKLQAIFEAADEDGGGGLDMEEFRNAMRYTMDHPVTDIELDMIFMKVDTNCDGTVDWDEYLTYMLLECQGRDTMNFLTTQPFARNVTHIKGEHRESIVKLLFVSKTARFASGTGSGFYVSVSQDGVVCFWDADLNLLDVHKVNEALGVALVDVWITDCTLMVNEQLIVIATTSRQIIFIDFSFHRFQVVCRIVGLETSATCLSYQNDEVLAKPPVVMCSYICWGNMTGGVSVLVLSRPFQQTKLAPTRGANNEVMVTRICFAELLKGLVQDIKAYYWPDIHHDLVGQIAYIPHLGAVLSCSKDSETSLFLGDFEQKVLFNYFNVKKGINSFDYDPDSNFIVTGGYDAVIRLWNPYVPAQPVMKLKSHQFPILFVIFSRFKEHIISISENKEVRIHDMNSQNCLQTFYKKMIGDMGPRALTAALFNPYRHTLIMATTQLAKIDQRDENNGLLNLTSSQDPVTIVLYNPVFKQVVSTGHDCKITVWKIFTGEIVMQFSVRRSHSSSDDDEISAMKFATHYRRLITASRSGQVRIINFNNGACLRELPICDIGLEISAITSYKTKIITGGWNRRVTMYVDNPDDDSVRFLQPSHKDDITSLATHGEILACASFDGVIFLWSLDTGRLVNRFCCDGKPSSMIFTTSSGYYTEATEAKLVIKPKIKCDLSLTTKSQIKSLAIKSRRKLQEITPPDMRVEKIITLETREKTPSIATLLSSHADGTIRAWSMHPAGTLLGSFRGVHLEQEISISTMATDTENKLLITGDFRGYIKVWDISCYCNGNVTETTVDHEMFPLVRLQRRLKERHMTASWLYYFADAPNFPPLLSSFGGHTKTVSSLAYVLLYGHEYILSSSFDCSIRLWNITGEFVGLYGQNHLFTASGFTHPEEEDHSPFKSKSLEIPGDIRRSGSCTTLFITQGGILRQWNKIINKLSLLKKAVFAIGGREVKKIEMLGIQENVDNVHKTESSHILGKSYKKKSRHKLLPKLPMPRQICTNVSVYNCLPFAELAHVQQVETPAVILEIRQRSQRQTEVAKCGPETRKKMKGGFRRFSIVNTLRRGSMKPKRLSADFSGHVTPDSSSLPASKDTKSHPEPVHVPPKSVGPQVVHTKIPDSSSPEKVCRGLRSIRE